jgi:hypothetical protein
MNMQIGIANNSSMLVSLISRNTSIDQIMGNTNMILQGIEQLYPIKGFETIIRSLLQQNRSDILQDINTTINNNLQNLIVTNNQPNNNFHIILETYEAGKKDLMVHFDNSIYKFSQRVNLTIAAYAGANDKLEDGMTRLNQDIDGKLTQTCNYIIMRADRGNDKIKAMKNQLLLQNEGIKAIKETIEENHQLAMSSRREDRIANDAND